MNKIHNQIKISNLIVMKQLFPNTLCSQSVGWKTKLHFAAKSIKNTEEIIFQYSNQRNKNNFTNKNEVQINLENDTILYAND